MEIEQFIQFGEKSSFAICIGRGNDPMWRTMNFWFSGFQYGFNDDSSLSVSLDWIEGVLLNLIDDSEKNCRGDLAGMSCASVWRILYDDSTSPDLKSEYRFLAGVEFDAFRGVAYSFEDVLTIVWNLDRSAWSLMPESYPKHCLRGSCPLTKVTDVVSEFSKWLQLQRHE